MVSFFKRSDSRTCVSMTTPALKAPTSDTDERRRSPRPLPHPEVVEGNDHSDWALWEASVSLQDSQMPSASLALTGAQKPGAPSGKKTDTTDAFVSVHKNSG